MALRIPPILRLTRKYFWRRQLQPEYVILISTSFCNLRCKHCFLWRKNPYGWGNLDQGKNDLSLEEIEKISQSMADFFFLNIGGGEPFIRKDLPKIVEAFYRNNHIQNLLIPTNGTLNEMILTSTKAILKNCPQLKVSIDVSIDGIGKLHNEIREGENTFNKAIKSLKDLLELKKEFPNLQVGTITSLMFYNQKHLEEIYNFLKKEIRPDSITLALTRGTPRQPRAKNIDIKYYRKLSRKMEKDFLMGKVSGFRKIIFWPVIIAAKVLMHRLVIRTKLCGYQLPCLAGQLNTVIYSNGDVYPCETLTNARLGNLRKANYDFQKLWRSEKLKKIVKKIKKSKCFCTHECHLPINILFSPKMLPKIFWLSWRLLISEWLFILTVSFILVFGYLILEGNFFPELVQLRTILPENTASKWEELGKTYEYAANNIFDKGYVREVGPEIHPRLSVYPEGKPLEKGLFVMPANSLESVVRLALPKGFKDGILDLQATTKSKYTVGVSYDLKGWKFYDYPGFAARALSSVSLEKGDLAKGYVYLKFLPSQNQNLTVYFDVFQYTSNLLHDDSEYYGLLFYPEVDIDYEGKEIIRPGILYDNRKSKTNN